MDVWASPPPLEESTPASPPLWLEDVLLPQAMATAGRTANQESRARVMFGSYSSAASTLTPAGTSDGTHARPVKECRCPIDWTTKSVPSMFIWWCPPFDARLESCAK